MSNNQLTLKPINDLLGELFFIPAYQRGYRWTERQVTELLNDIRDFQQQSENSKKETFYCLQPVVVRKRQQSWEVVDGQQRLTTIFIILTYLKDIATLLGKQRYQISYETRPNCAQFLQEIDESRSNENIDFYHICAAKKAVENWFKQQDGAYKLKFIQTLLNPDDIGKNVKVIWYDIQEDIDPIDVFTRLNIGKIPLTNSELVKALFLRSGNFGKDDANGQISLRQVQIAQAWDDIERALQHDDFWYFLNNKDTYTNRIEIVLALIANQLTFNNPQDIKSDHYYIFIAFFNWFKGDATLQNSTEATTAVAKWEIVQQHFLQLEEWFEHRVWFHLIGFLIDQGVSIRSIFTQNSTIQGKTLFVQHLKQEIFNKLFTTDKGDLKALITKQINELEYGGGDNQKLRAALLLFNIASILHNPSTNIRFQFDSYKKGQWDLEHIRSVQSRKPERPDAQKQWLRSVLEYSTKISVPQDTNDYTLWRQQIQAQPSPSDLHQLCLSAIDVLETQPFSSSAFNDLYLKILQHFGESSETEVDNSIANLALLDSHTNRSYGNAIFPIKRRRIVELDKDGTFVPLCTKNVFLKYYSHHAGDLMFWKAEDATDYQAEIIDTLTWFLGDNNLEQLV